MNDSLAETDDLVATLKLLKCIICDNILSVPPILTISDHEYQCGRCKDIKYPTAAMRNDVFEKVAKYLKFPCTYPNCDSLLLWKNVEIHEKNCPFRTITCPVFQEKCNEKINWKELTEHMVQKHKSNMFYENIMVTVSFFKSSVCVASVNDVIFLVYISTDKVLVTALKPSPSQFQYTLKICGDNKNKPSIVYENQPIEEFNEKKHCFRCLDKCCDVKNHPFSTFNKYIIDDPINSDLEQIINKNKSLATPVQTKSTESSGPIPKNGSTSTSSLPIHTDSSSSSLLAQAVSSSIISVSTTTNSIFGKNSVSFGTKSVPATFNNISQQAVPSNKMSVSATTGSIFGIKEFSGTKSVPATSNSPIKQVVASRKIIVPPFSNSICNNTVPSKLMDDKVTKNISSDYPSKKKATTVDIGQSNTFNSCFNFKQPSSKTLSSGFSFKTEKRETQMEGIKCTTLPNLHTLIGLSSFVTFKITITSNEDTESLYSNDSFIPKNLPSPVDNSDLLRKTLQCPVCAEYMVGSIYFCVKGHNICNKCRTLLTCPSCQGVILDARNLALEDMAKGVSLCCIFKENGCNFRGNLKMISEHKKNCTLKTDKNDNVM